MALEVYDFRNDEHICQMLVSPEMRCRFLRAEPGTVQSVLQGQCEFTVHTGRDDADNGAANLRSHRWLASRSSAAACSLGRWPTASG